MSNNNIDLAVYGYGERVKEEGAFEQRRIEMINEEAMAQVLHIPDNPIQMQQSRKIVLEPVYARRKIIYLMVKRLFDIISSFIGIVCGLVPMIIIAIMIKLDSKGPVIFKQERLGLNGKPFKLYKFRSMHVDAEKNGAQWAQKHDPRVTRVGNILRKTRLDEIPQFFNIFLGQMSFVGPRPERKIFYDQFETYIEGFSQRLQVKPGLTGWAQVNGGYDLLPEEKVIYDIEYIKKQSLMMDLKCILKTIKIVFTHNGAR